MSHASVLVAIEPTDDPEAVVAEQMAPFEEGDAGWFADGSRWDCYEIGGRFSGMIADDDQLRRGDVDIPALRLRSERRFQRIYAHLAADNYRWDWKDEAKSTTAEQYVIERVQDFPAHYAFLRNHVWQEKERMGWFGAPTSTECANAGLDVHICTHEKDGARIVSWSDSKSWNKMFYPRFVEPLPPETLLVTVDYHV